jgi:alanine racemase
MNIFSGESQSWLDRVRVRGNMCSKMSRVQLLRRLPFDARRTWAEISLSQILKNYRAIQRRAGKLCQVMAVVKANAYGHGIAVVSRYLAAHGVCWFGVSTLEEALELRRVGIRENIMILGTFFPAQASAAVEQGIHVTASSIDHLNALQRAASKRKPALVHLKFDTGMGRLGFSHRDAEWMARRWGKGKWNPVRLQGICSHLASAEEVDSPQNATQAQNFLDVLAAFDVAGVEVPIRHMANSAGTAFHPHLRFDLVRVGIALYGYEPRVGGMHPMGVSPALALRTRILQLKTVPRGTALGYHATFVAERQSIIATLPIGYADGVNLRLSFSNMERFRHTNAQARPMQAIVRDQAAPLVGRVSMDLTSLDVTDVKGVRVNDVVILLGQSRAHAISPVDWAAHLSTIPYEILCAISPHVYRIYVE